MEIFLGFVVARCLEKAVRVLLRDLAALIGEPVRPWKHQR